jgi:hypothetical protein
MTPPPMTQQGRNRGTAMSNDINEFDDEDEYDVWDDEDGDWDEEDE